MTKIALPFTKTTNNCDEITRYCLHAMIKNDKLLPLNPEYMLPWYLPPYFVKINNKVEL